MITIDSPGVPILLRAINNLIHDSFDEDTTTTTLINVKWQLERHQEANVSMAIRVIDPLEVIAFDSGLALSNPKRLQALDELRHRRYTEKTRKACRRC